MATREELLAEAQRRGLVPADDGGIRAEAIRRGLIPPASNDPSMADQIGRQLGLTGRYAVEGALQLPGMIANVPASLANTAMDAAGVDWQRFPDQNAAVSAALTRAGLPQPETATERVVGDISRTLSGTGAVLGVAGNVAGGATGATQRAAETLAANPAAQAASAVGAGGAGGLVREGGGGPWEQFAASLLGGIAAPYALSKAQQAGQAAAGAVRRALAPNEIDSQVKIVFERAGVHWADLSEGARRSLVEDAKAAVYSGQQLDDAALRRLADYRVVGAKPLTGDITQDPGLITQQRNLAKQQANMGATLGDDLSSVQNQNAKTVLSTLDDAARSPSDSYATGQAIIDKVSSVDDAIATKQSALYKTARDAAGQDIPLSRRGFIDNAFDALTKENKLAFLPPEVRAMLNDISLGEVTVNGQKYPTPFDVRTIDSLKTTLAAASQSPNGNTRAAVKLVRQALDNVQPEAHMPSFGGTQVATAADTAKTAQVAALPAEALKLLDKARKLSRTRFEWRESSPFIEDALTGADPNKFVQKHIIGGKVEDLAKLRKLVGGDPAMREAVRARLIEYIKNRGNADSDVTRFSSKGMEDGLKALGDRKLTMWFTPQELAKVKSAINVAKYMQAQPIGSAVNNSNSGAVVVAKALEGLQKVASVAPLGIGTTINGISTAVKSRQLQDLGSALAVPSQPQPLPAVPLLFGAGAVVPPRDKDSRN